MVGPSNMNFTAPLDGVARKTKVLVFNKFYLPGYRAGGPIRTIANMVDRLGGSIEFWIVTADRDSGDTAPYADVDLHGWNAQGNAQVRYVALRGVSLKSIQGLIEEVSPDSIYLNSFFDPVFTHRVLWLRRLRKLRCDRIVLAPRGEFSAGALGLKSVRKRVFLRVAKVLGLYKNVTWQVSSDHEKRDLQSVLGSLSGSDVKVAMNLAPSLRSARRPEQLRDQDRPLQLCFLSRVAPMKNLDFALSCLRDVKAKVDFSIYGPIGVPSYWTECKSIIASLPRNISVTYMGEVAHHRVAQVLSGHDLFFLPTRGENYGHVIYEALSAGLPVLISDRTPWRDLEDHGVGWVYPLDSTAAFSNQIDRCASAVSATREAASQRSREYAHLKADDASVLQANLELFCSVSRPEQK